MPKHVAFLRAINVGGHTVKMDNLRELFEEIGFSDVATYIASGNVIFDSLSKNVKDVESKIEIHLRDSLGYDVATFIRTMSELIKIAEYMPFSGGAKDIRSGTVYVAFLGKKPTEGLKKKLLSYTSATDEFHFHGKELYWLCRTRMMESSFSGALLEKTLGMPATLRNMNTIKKIIKKFLDIKNNESLTE